MRDGLPRAKITPPRLPGVLPRERLFRRLDRDGTRRIAWVTGPPGSGKTTLVCSYLAARSLSSVWYQLDRGDADPATFFYYLSRAARSLVPRLRLPVLTPEYQAGVPMFASRFFERLYAGLPPSSVLVLENYHEISDVPALHQPLAESLAGIPDRAGLIVVSRTAPPPALARLGPDRTLDILGWDDLRFTEDEAIALARLRVDERVSSPDVAAIHRTTDGWAAGITLMLNSADVKGRPPAWKSRRSRDAMFAYFTGEILERLDEPVRTFLCRTAFFPHLTAAMAARVTGLRTAGRILDELVRRHYFVTRREEDEPVYQYHDLFRAFLRSRIDETFTPVERVQLQHRTAAVLEAKGLLDEAMALYQAAADWAAVARLTLREAPALMAQGRTQTLETWLRAIPHGADDPWISYWWGVCLLSVSPAQARAHLTDAFDRFCAQHEVVGMLSAWCGAVDTLVYEWADLTPLDRWIGWMDTYLDAAPAYPSVDLEVRVAVGMASALLYRQPHHPELSTWVDRIETLAPNVADRALTMRIAMLLINDSAWRGDFARLDLALNTLQALAEAPGAAPLSRISYCWWKAAAHWLAGRSRDAIRTALQGLRIAHCAGITLWEHHLYAQIVYGALAGGDVRRAEASLGRLAAHTDRGRALDMSHLHYLSGYCAATRHNLSRAVQEARKALDLAVVSGAPFPEALCRLALAQMHCELGERRKAAAHLPPIRRIARAMDTRLLEYGLLLVQAQLAPTRAGERVLLRRAMAMGREQGFVNIPWWRPKAMAMLCARALEAGIEVDYVRSLIRARDLEPPTSDCAHWPWRIMILTLGRVEILIEGRPLQFSGKAQRRPLELLMALISLGGREVHESRLSEALWEEADADAARVAFKSTLYRLRKLLGDDALVLRDARLSLNARTVWVDAWAFEQTSADTAKPDVAERALALYQGTFLGDTAAPWALPARERMRAKFLRCLTAVSHGRMQDSRHNEALQILERGLEADPLAEELYRRIMRCHAALGRRAEALAAYERCRTMLSTMLGIAPAPETETIRRALRENRLLPT